MDGNLFLDVLDCSAATKSFHKSAWSTTLNEIRLPYIQVDCSYGMVMETKNWHTKLMCEDTRRKDIFEGTSREYQKSVAVFLGSRPA